MRKLRREEEERAAEDTAGIESEKTGGEESDVEKASGSASGILHELAKDEKASGCFSTLTPPQDGRSG